MLQLRLLRALKLRNNPHRQHLPQLHAPLVKRINLPDRPLHKNTVLIKRHQLAQNMRRESISEDGVRRTIALKNAVRHQPIGCSFGFDLFGRLAESQGFGLRKNVGQEHIVVPAERIEGFYEGDEITRD